MRIIDLLRPTFYKKIYRKINDKLLIRLNPDYARIRRINQHLDIISLGSNPGKYGIEFTHSGLKGHNLAVGPQTIEYDFRMLKNYHSYLDEKGDRIVLMVLCPFSLCKYRYTDTDRSVAKDIRYYPILHHSLINGYDPVLYRKWKKHTLFRLLNSPGLIKAALRGGDRRLFFDTNPLDDIGMETSAISYMSGWKREFKLENINESSSSPVVEDALEKNGRILDDMIRFCEERNITPVVVFPPVSRHLLEKIPVKFREKNLYSLIRERSLKVLDYMEADGWINNENFVDALCLNRKGRIKFTEEIGIRLRKEKLLHR